MTRFYLGLSVFLASLLPLICVNAQDQDKEVSSTTITTTQSPEGDTIVKEVTKTTRIVTPVPAAKEVIAAPEGYTVCFKVEEGWFNNIWVPTHQVCQYENAVEGVVWIEGYWGCSKATPEGICSNWEWKSGHWEKKLAVY